MPRVTREQTESNHEAITEASSRLFRERGLHGVSVAELMGAAGLTHGGFYGHFDSKDALAAEACTRAFEEGDRRWQRRMAGQGGAAARVALIEGYLTARNRDRPGTSCPSAALVNDVAREPAESPVRAAFLAGVEARLALLESVQQTGDATSDRQGALADYATMLGALLLARATQGSELADAFLEAGRGRLIQAVGDYSATP